MKREWWAVLWRNGLEIVGTLYESKEEARKDRFARERIVHVVEVPKKKVRR
jgi:hypothetical protein